MTAPLGCKRLRMRAAKSKPPVILIVIDTLRADHVGCYGYSRPTTPNIDEFSAKAVRFANTYAPASWTVPSMNSIFTGVYPWKHGVVFAETQQATVSTQQVLSDKFTTLAESLQKAGYSTWGVAANYHMHEQYGIAQGYEHYKTFNFSDRGPVDQQMERWLPQIRRTYKQGKGQPYFLYIHYFDAHHPYKIAEPFTSKINPNLDRKEAARFGTGDFPELATKGYFFEHPDKMQILVDLYDGEILADDDSVGRWLKTLPGIDDAIVVVTADHGEAFGEHETMIHGLDLYSETINVPLLIKLPGNEHGGMVVNDHVSLIDIFPTLAGLAGAQKPDYLEGVDLSPLWKGNQIAERMLYSGTERSSVHTWFGAIGQQYKLVYLDNRNVYKMYDIQADPHEKNDIYDIKNKIALEYRKLLAEPRSAEPIFNPGVTGEAMSDELRETLRSLGYI